MCVCGALWTQAPSEPASLLASWKDVLMDTADASEGEKKIRRWEGQVRLSMCGEAGKG